MLIRGVFGLLLGALCAGAWAAAIKPAPTVIADAPLQQFRLNYRASINGELVSTGELIGPAGKRIAFAVSAGPQASPWRIKLTPSQGEDRLITLKGSVHRGTALIQKINFTVRTTGTIDLDSPDHQERMQVYLMITPITDDEIKALQADRAATPEPPLP